MGNATSIFDCAVNPLHPLPSEEIADDLLAPPVPTLLHGPTPLRDSVLWKLQTDYYNKYGDKAWSEAIVPHFVSSNAFIALTYTRIIISALKDAAALYSSKLPISSSLSADKNESPYSNNPLSVTEPVYIIEAGAGHGQLSFLIINYLTRYRTFLPSLQSPQQTQQQQQYRSTTSSSGVDSSSSGIHLPFKYIITDASSTCVDNIRNHPNIQEWIAQGFVDVAVWDATTGTTTNVVSTTPTQDADASTFPKEQLYLQYAQQTIQPGTLKYPPIIIANYTVNSLQMDAFRIETLSSSSVVGTDGSIKTTNEEVDIPSTTTEEEEEKKTVGVDNNKTISSSTVSSTASVHSRQHLPIVKQVYVSLTSSRNENNPFDPDILRRVSPSWDYIPIPSLFSPSSSSSTRPVFNVKQLPLPYANDKILQSILYNYIMNPRIAQLGGTVLIPIGGIHLLANVRKLGGDSAIVLIGDKGFNYVSELTDTFTYDNKQNVTRIIRKDPHIAFHGSFSMMVNFHALRMYTRIHGGYSVSTPSLDGFKVSTYFFSKNTPYLSNPVPICASKPVHFHHYTKENFVTNEPESKGISPGLLAMVHAALVQTDGNKANSHDPSLAMAPAGCSLSTYKLSDFEPWNASTLVPILNNPYNTHPSPAIEKELPQITNKGSDTNTIASANGSLFTFDSAVLDDDDEVNYNTLRDHSHLPFPRTRQTALEVLHTFTPEDFATLQRSIRDEIVPSTTATNIIPSLKHILALLRLSHHDPEVFLKFKSTLIERVGSSYTSESVQKDTAFDIERIYGNYFPLQKNKDVCFELGRVCMSLHDFPGAVAFFTKSNEYCGDHHITWYNAGICYFYAGDPETASKCFQHCLTLNPEYEDARQWLGKATAHARSSPSTSASGTGTGSPTTMDVSQYQQDNSTVSDQDIHFTMKKNYPEEYEEEDENAIDQADGGMSDEDGSESYDEEPNSSDEQE